MMVSDDDVVIQPMEVKLQARRIDVEAVTKKSNPFPVPISEIKKAMTIVDDEDMIDVEMDVELDGATIKKGNNA